MKTLIFLLIYLIFSRETIAATYFDFTSDDYLIKYNGELEVDLHYNLINYSENDFRVKPVSPSASVFVYSPEIEDWVKSSSSWLEMPNLSKNLSLKAASNEPLDIFLEVQNINTSEIYLTSPKKYYPYAYLQRNFRNPVLTIPLQSKTNEPAFNKMIKYLNGLFEKF